MCFYQLPKKHNLNNLNFNHLPPTALTDAERGALYNKANSPKASPYFNVFFRSSFIII